MYLHRFPLLEAYRKDNPEGQSAAALADRMISLCQDGRFREVVVLFSQAVPIVPRNVLGDEQLERAAYYNLALISHRAKRFADAQRFMELSGLSAGGDFDFLLYHDRLALSERLAAQQQRAIFVGKPAIFFTALQKSASAFLSVCMSEILEVPVLRASIGLPDGLVIGRWAEQIARGGAITHEHYPGSAVNIKTLAEAGAGKIFVQVRDPRAAWWSLSQNAHRKPDIAAVALSPQEWYSDAIRWLQSWIDASRAPNCPFQVVIVLYDDVRLMPEDTIERIFDEIGYRIPRAEIARYFDARSQSGRTPENFRVGEPEDWRRGMPPELAADFWRETPESVRDLLSMTE
jgi:hypothetical protein